MRFRLQRHPGPRGGTQVVTSLAPAQCPPRRGNAAHRMAQAQGHKVVVVSSRLRLTWSRGATRTALSSSVLP